MGRASTQSLQVQMEQTSPHHGSGFVSIYRELQWNPTRKPQEHVGSPSPLRTASLPRTGLIAGKRLFSGKHTKNIFFPAEDTYDANFPLILYFLPSFRTTLISYRITAAPVGLGFCLFVLFKKNHTFWSFTLKKHHDSHHAPKTNLATPGLSLLPRHPLPKALGRPLFLHPREQLLVCIDFWFSSVLIRAVNRYFRAQPFPVR